MEFLHVFWAVLVFFVVFLILKQHNGDCEVQNEERAHDNAQQEIDLYEPDGIGVLKHVGHINPAFQGDALENGQEGLW